MKLEIEKVAKALEHLRKARAILVDLAEKAENEKRWDFVGSYRHFADNVSEVCDTDDGSGLDAVLLNLGGK